jgi:glycogen debranching enzyme
VIWTQPEDGPVLRVGPEGLVPFETGIEREWLLTNGLGGFAGSTVVGANTRRYHGLLVSATHPPVGRIVSVAKLEETVHAPHSGKPTGERPLSDEERPVEFEISCNQYPDTVHPQGFLHLESFSFGRRPRWRYRLRDLWLEKTVFLAHRANTAVVVYSHLDGPDAELSLRPLIVHRDYHALSRENSALNPRPVIFPGIVTLRPYLGLPAIRMACSHGSFLPWPVWYKALEYPCELERGLDFREDAFSPGTFVLKLSAGESCVLALSNEDPFPGGAPSDPALAGALGALVVAAAEHGPESPQTGEAGQRFQRALVTWAERLWLDEEARLRRLEAAPARARDAGRRLRAERAKDFGLPADAAAVAGGAVSLAAPPPPAPLVRSAPEPVALPTEERLPEDGLRLLARAANQFWVRRGPSGDSVLAGYPWFTDGGRDAMISLPGLMLATGRLDLARSVLAGFCQQLDAGMIPSRFPDVGAEPRYRSIDATLWMFRAADYYVRLSGDEDLLRGTLYPAFREVISHHQRGTRHDIRLAEDGLLVAGKPAGQLTWMDARVEDWVVTPRRGKAVEVNALWHFALTVQSAFAARLGSASDSSYYSALAARVRDAFHATFWAESLGRFYDAVDEEGPDPSLRPNQVIALSLPGGLVPPERAQRVLPAVERLLVTPVGLRSLAPGDPRYRGTYSGDRVTRDGAYHQGTVWAWLLGPYVSAYLNARGRSPASRAHARRLLAPLVHHLASACLGTVSEIFDGDPPHRARGSMAQAWSVAELARVWIEEEL